MLDANIQQSAGSLLAADNILSPSDSKAIKFNIQRLEEFDKKAKVLESSLKVEDEKLFVKSGKIRSGEQCAHKFNEGCFSSLLKLKSDISTALVKLQETSLNIQQEVPLSLKRESRTKTGQKVRNVNMHVRM